MRLRSWIMSLVTVAFSTFVALLGVEAVLRLVYLDDPLTTRNFTADQVNHQVTNIMIAYDPVVGYIMRPSYRGGPDSIGHEGIRLNRKYAPEEESPPIPTGGILASGDSFTYGSEVNDAESWPAQLEGMLGVPVVNAGGGGYGMDQAVLRAEQLLETVKPRVVVVSFIPEAVTRNEFSVNGGLVKPYFDVKKGALVLRNTPPPENYQPAPKHLGQFRSIFGHSYTAYWIADRVGLRSHWMIHEPEYRKENSDGVEVSCLLWQRLADRVKGEDIALVALPQYAGTHLDGGYPAREIYEVEYVLDCARRAGVLVVDSYDELARRHAADRPTFWQLWVKHPHNTDRHTGHMSPEGNRLTAEILAKAIRTHLSSSLDGAPTVVGNR